MGGYIPQGGVWVPHSGVIGTPRTSPRVHHADHRHADHADHAGLLTTVRRDGLLGSKLEVENG